MARRTSHRGGTEPDEVAADSPIQFRTTIVLGGKTATGLEVPTGVVERLGRGKRPPVSVTIRGFTYRTTVAVMGGAFMIPLSAENRAGAGAAAGDEVDVEIALDTEPRELTVPADFASALADVTGARAAFDRLAYSRRREHVRAVEDAKTPETRQRRIDKAISQLREQAR